MNLLGYILIAVFAALVAYVGVEIFRRQGIARNWFDIPNERSLHSCPTPRGGGLIIVLICLFAYVVLGIITPDAFSWGYFVGAILVSGVSWVDDLYSLSIKWRLTVQFISALLVVITNGYFVAVGLPNTPSVVLGVFGVVVTLFWIVWIVNAYNFMDGIDGIAAVQAIVAALGWAAVASVLGVPQIILFCIILLGAASGFLAHNWSPARVFLGDVGSAFFGYTFATLPLLLARHGAEVSWLPLAAVFFIWPFIFDSAVTLARRLANGQRVWEPHREHLYQTLIIAGYSHAFAALAYLAFATLSTAGFLITIQYSENAIFSVLFLISISLVFVGSIILLTRRTTSEQVDVNNGRS
jgi:UDP-N-acetylmuramyl pentapeptide phosphotransferase/UDP-N-acetylglucosamine-1-phosphate transferase